MSAPKGHSPYPGCENGGRPLKYTKQFIENEATAFLEWMKRPTSIWYKDFALERGYNPDLLSLWAKENEKFSGVYALSQHWQQSKLVNGGLLCTFNASFTKFVMANTCGWADKTQQMISGDTVNPLSFLLQSCDGKSKELVHENEE